MMTRPTCLECSRTFDLADPTDADEWTAGHDCEPAELPAGAEPDNDLDALADELETEYAAAVIRRQAMTAYPPACCHVTYTGSDGQRHAAVVLAHHPDGTVTIRRGYYDPPEGTRTRWTPADRMTTHIYRLIDGRNRRKSAER
jgi:hypothetical protein